MLAAPGRWCGAGSYDHNILCQGAESIPAFSNRQELCRTKNGQKNILFSIAYSNLLADIEGAAARFLSMPYPNILCPPDDHKALTSYAPDFNSPPPRAG